MIALDGLYLLCAEVQLCTYLLYRVPLHDAALSYPPVARKLRPVNVLGKGDELEKVIQQ